MILHRIGFYMMEVALKSIVQMELGFMSMTNSEFMTLWYSGLAITYSKQDYKNLRKIDLKNLKDRICTLLSNIRSTIIH